MINSVSMWYVAKCLMLVLFVCMCIHFTITIGHVTYGKYRDVERFRQVALDEMEQDCCKIFYSNKALFGVTPGPQPTALVAFGQASSEPPPSPDKIQACQRILSEEKRQGKTNRCETSQDIIKHWMSYQVLLEVWKHYFPLADVSFSQYILGGGMTFVANLLGGYVIRKVAF